MKKKYRVRQREPHYKNPINEKSTPDICVALFWNFDMIVAIPINNATIVNGTGNKFPPVNALTKDC